VRNRRYSQQVERAATPPAAPRREAAPSREPSDAIGRSAEGEGANSARTPLLLGVPQRHTRGQASAEYVAILLVIALALAGATALGVAVPGVGARVVKTVRTGICIVGGDVCRTSDAAAAGLAPCVTATRSKRQDTTLDIAVVRLGGHGVWQLALQSDGQAVVTRLEENEVGGSVGVGVSFSPAGVKAAASATLAVGYRGGRAWRFPDAAAAAAFLNGAMHDSAVHGARPPDVRWHAIAGSGDGEAGVAIADLARAGLETGVDAAIGLRSDGDRRTLTLDLGTVDPRLSADLPGFTAGAGTDRSVVADLTWEAGAVRELALRTAIVQGHRLEEHTARLDLREPASRALAERLLRTGGSIRGDMRALARHAAGHGVVERAGYIVSERDRGFDAAAKLGIALGVSHHRITAERRLVDAVAWVRGGPAQRRFDCLGT